MLQYLFGALIITLLKYFDSGFLLVLASRDVSTFKLTHKKAAGYMPQLEDWSSKLSHRQSAPYWVPSYKKKIGQDSQENDHMT